MLVMARQALGLTQADFAPRVGLSQATVSKLEDGLLPGIESSTLGKIAGATGYPPAFFLQTGVQRPLRDPFYRKRSSLSAKTIKQCEALINITTLELEKLLRKTEADPRLPLPSWSADYFPGGPREVARQLRTAWNVPRGPLLDLISLIEDAGIIVMPFDFGNAGIDGMNVALPGGDHVIFYNSKMPAVRQRHTIAHELGHAIMHKVPSSDAEDEAFAFASEFLMPEADIRGTLYPLDLDLLLRLKRKWLVSMQAILYWANLIGVIKDSYYKYMFIKIGKSGWRKSEPLDDQIQAEKPQLVSDLVNLHLNELGYSEEELRLSLNANINTFARQYLGAA